MYEMLDKVEKLGMVPVSMLVAWRSRQEFHAFVVVGF